MNATDNLNEAFDQLSAARQADTGTKEDAAAIGSCAYNVAFHATALMEERRRKEPLQPLPTLTPLPPLMTAEQLKEILK